MATPSAPLSPSTACTDLIRHFEGCILAAYPDPGTGGDPWTIGTGHTGPEVRRGLTWTQEQCDEALDRDLVRFTVGVRALITTAPTTQGQFDAMVSLAFNIGLANLKSSTLLRYHLASKFWAARLEFAKWNRANGHAMAGLTARREAEADLYAS